MRTTESFCRMRTRFSQKSAADFELLGDRLTDAIARRVVAVRNCREDALGDLSALVALGNRPVTRRRDVCNHGK
jgi:hypothetical protein